MAQLSSEIHLMAEIARLKHEHIRKYPRKVQKITRKFEKIQEISRKIHNLQRKMMKNISNKNISTKTEVKKQHQKKN